MAQFKRDRKIIFLSPLTSIHNVSEIRSHGGPPEGEGLRHSIIHPWSATVKSPRNFEYLAFAENAHTIGKVNPQEPQ